MGGANQARMERLETVLKSEPGLANQILSADEAPTPLFCLPDDEAAAADVARVLLDHGADPTVSDAQGRTAIAAARERGLDEAADLMEAVRHAG